jgi:hypothetical protein
MPTGTLRLPLLRFFRAFSLVVRQMPRFSTQRRGTARTLPKNFVLFHVLFVLCRSVYCLCMCKCVLYYCDGVANQLQLNISYHISHHITSYHKYFRMICADFCKKSSSLYPNILSMRASNFVPKWMTFQLSNW